MFKFSSPVIENFIIHKVTCLIRPFILCPKSDLLIQVWLYVERSWNVWWSIYNATFSERFRITRCFNISRIISFSTIYRNKSSLFLGTKNKWPYKTGDFMNYEIFYDRRRKFEHCFSIYIGIIVCWNFMKEILLKLRKMWPFNTCGCLIQVATSGGLTVLHVSW
jgi:hypothetical protein